MLTTMQRVARYATAVAFLACSAAAYADDFSDTVDLFKSSSESAAYFGRSYGYAVFPTVGEGGFIVAGAHGTGRVYARGNYVGDATMTQVTVGAQVGGQAYSQIIFFANERAFRDFTSGHYQFGADASAVAITAAAQASAGTSGASAGATDGSKDATKGTYHKGVAVFTIVKGGAMLQAAIGGQKFGYKPKGR